MTGLLLLLFGVAGQWLLGIALAALVLRSARRTELLGTGLVLGIGTTAFLQFLWSLFGGSLGRPLSLVLALAGWIAGLVLLWRTPRKNRSPEPELGKPGESLVRFCRTVVIVLFLLTLAQALLTPQRFWDERAIFAIKARVLYEDESIHSRDLLHPDFVQYHPRYPLLLPLAEQHVYALLGEANDRWAKVVPPLLYLGLVLAFAGVACRDVRRDQAWLFAVLLAGVPVLTPWEYGFISAQADAPLAAFHGVSILYLWSWLRTRWQSHENQPADYGVAIVAGLAAGLALFTKDEGIAFFAVDLVAAGLLIVPNILGPNLAQRLGRTGVQIGLYGAAVALIALPWFWHRRHLPTATEMSYAGRLSADALTQGMASLSWSIPHLVRRMFLEAPEWGLTWWLVPLAGLTKPRRAIQAPQLLLILDIAGAIAALLVAGMIAPTPVEEHLGGSSHRFLLQLVPVGVLFGLAQWGASPGAESQP